MPDSMWGQFTERARKVIFQAQEETRKAGEHYVGTEHLLLGLMNDLQSVAGKILVELNAPIEFIRRDIMSHMLYNMGDPTDKLQLTPASKRVIDLTYNEALQLNNDYVGTEHLLLALIQEENGLAGRTLKNHGVTHERVLEILLRIHDVPEELHDALEALSAHNSEERTPPPPII